MTAAADPASEVATLDATGQAELVRRGEVTAAELTEWAIGRIERLNPQLNAVVTPMYDDARARVNAGVSGPLAGVPYLLKDLVAEVAAPGSPRARVFLRDNVSSFDSELVVRLRRAGLVILGKTNTPEFGMVPTCEPVLFGPTRNPWDAGRSTSGSSGGSAAAVARGMVPMAHGNDLGGSLRYPASACGLFGLKPTRARIPLGPEYGDAISGWAASTRSPGRSATAPRCWTPRPGPPPATPTGRRRRPGRSPARSAPTPAGCASPGPPAPPDGSPAHPDCVAALERRGRAVRSRWATTWWRPTCRDSPPRSGPPSGPCSTPRPRGSSSTGSGGWAASRPDELEPLTRAVLGGGPPDHAPPTTCWPWRTPRPMPGGWPRS